MYSLHSSICFPWELRTTEDILSFRNLSFTCKALDFFPWPLQDSRLSHLARYLPTTSPQWSRAWFRSPQTIISKSTSGRQAINRRRCNCCWTSSASAPTCCSLAKFLTTWVRLPSIRCVIVVPLITNNWLPAGDSLPLDRTRRLPPEVTFSTNDFTTGRRAFSLLPLKPDGNLTCRGWHLLQQQTCYLAASQFHRLYKPKNTSRQSVRCSICPADKKNSLGALNWPKLSLLLVPVYSKCSGQVYVNFWCPPIYSFPFLSWQLVPGWLVVHVDANDRWTFSLECQMPWALI